VLIGTFIVVAAEIGILERKITTRNFVHLFIRGGIVENLVEGFDRLPDILAIAFSAGNGGKWL